MRNIARYLVTLAIGSSVVTASLAAQTYTSEPHVVFFMTNNADHNQVVAYKNRADDSFVETGRFETGGRGSGGSVLSLESQGSLTLSQDHSFLFAVNAGSGEISVFKVNGSTLTLVGNTPCGGSEPVA